MMPYCNHVHQCHHHSHQGSYKPQMVYNSSYYHRDVLQVDKGDSELSGHHRREVAGQETSHIMESLKNHPIPNYQCNLHLLLLLPQSKTE